jgi:hypothetical protein
MKTANDRRRSTCTQVGKIGAGEACGQSGDLVEVDAGSGRGS